MDTPPSIRLQYASPPRELPEQRRRRLANRRAAKYRHFRSLDRAEDARQSQRHQDARRQRARRSQQDDETRDRVRAQNRRRQQLRRQSLSTRAQEEVREKQRERQRVRRQTLDDEAREELRARERQRIRRRHLKALKTQEEAAQEQLQLPHLRLAPELPTLRAHQEQQRQREMQRLPFGGGVQLTLLPPPPMERVMTFPRERIPSLPHLQQVTRTTSLLATPSPSLFGMNTGAGNAASSGQPTVAEVVAATRPTPIMPLAALPMPRTPIVLPPAHRSLPPLPDFLNSREAFNPATAAVSVGNPMRASRPSSRALFPYITDLPTTHDDSDAFFQR